MVFALCPNDCTSKWFAEIFIFPHRFLLMWVEAHSFICFRQIYVLMKKKRRRWKKQQLEWIAHVAVFLDTLAPVVWPLHKDFIGIGKCEINKTKRCEPFFLTLALGLHAVFQKFISFFCCYWCCWSCRCSIMIMIFRFASNLLFHLTTFPL